MTRDERSALSKLKSSDNVFRIQDKGSRFVIISQNEYKDKMLGQISITISLIMTLLANISQKLKTGDGNGLVKDRSVKRSPLGLLIWNLSRGWHLATSRPTKKATLSA